MPGEVLEECADRPAQAGQVAGLDPGGRGQPALHIGFVQMKDQVVRAQAGNIAAGVEAFQRVVEVVRQEHFLEIRLVQHMLFPVRAGHELLGRVEKRGAVGEGNAVALEVEESAADLEEPLVLHRVVKLGHVVKDGADALACIHAGGQRSLVHAHGVSQLGVVVVAKNLIEAARRRPPRIDVRMRIDERDVADLGVQVLSQPVVKHRSPAKRLTFPGRSPLQPL